MTKLFIRRKLNIRSGLTLLELLIVMAILLVVLSSSIFVTFSYYVRNQVDNTISIIVETTRRTQTLSRNAVEDSAWGIKVTDTQVIMFKANDGDSDGNPDSFAEGSRDKAFDRAYEIPAEAIIGESSQVELIFDKLTGLPRIGSNLAIQVMAGDYVRQISINQLGTINYGDTTVGETNCSVARESCLAHKAVGCSTDGNYLIENGGDPVEAFCDMTIDGGGWTKLNGDLVSISVNKGTASWSGDNIVGTGGTAAGCADTFANRRQYTLTTPEFDYSDVYVLLTRTTTVLQCSNISVGGGAYTGWFNTPYAGTSTANTTCGWSDGIWANGTQIQMSGLKLDWVLKKTGDNPELLYETYCAYTQGQGVPPDNGAFTMQWFVK